MRRVVCAGLAALALGGLARTAAAQDPGVACADPGGIARVVPEACGMQRAAALALDAARAETAVCAEQGLGLGALCERAEATCSESPECAPACGALDALVEASTRWERAAEAADAAWAGTPFGAVAVLERAASVRRTEAALREACAQPARAVSEAAARRDAYAERVRAVHDGAALCASRVELFGAPWSRDARGRVVHAPLAEAVLVSCARRRPVVTRMSPSERRARAVARAMVELLRAADPALVVQVEGSDPSATSAACGLLAPHRAAESAAGLDARCGTPGAPPIVVEPCDAVTPGARVACATGLAARSHPLSSESLGASEPAELLRAALRGTTRTEERVQEARSERFVLTYRALETDACRRAREEGVPRLGKPLEQVGVEDARWLMMLARCSAHAADELSTDRAARALHRVREAALRSPSFARSPDARGLAALAGVSLALMPGRQAEGNEVLDALASTPALDEELARAMAGGREPDLEARTATAHIAAQAFERAAHVAIEERRFEVARRAIDAQRRVGRGGRDDVLSARTELAVLLLEVELAMAEGNRNLAVRRTRDAERARATTDPPLRHALRAREVELGVREPPRGLVAADCDRDLVVRGVVRRADALDGRGEGIEALLAVLAEDAARAPVTRGPCVNDGDFPELAVRAGIVEAELVARCFSVAERARGGVAQRACGMRAEDAVTRVAASLGRAGEALGRFVELLAVRGEVARTARLLRASEALRTAAEVHTAEGARSAWRARGASESVLAALDLRALGIAACTADPDVSLALRWDAGRAVPGCQVELPADPATTTLVYVHHERDGAQRYALWVARGASLEHVDLGPAARIETRIARLQRTLADPSRDAREAARTVYEALLGPVGARLPARGTWVVVPDADATLVPFEALEDRRGPLARTDGPRIRYALRPGALADDARIPRDAAAVVVADPRFGPRDGAGAIPRLPATAREAQSVCAVFPCAERRLLRGGAGEGPVRAAILAQSGRLGVVHLATHAVFREARAVVLLAGVGDALPGPTAWSSDADGWLTERELAGLGLVDTELVVLSACATARGEARAGVRGLGRAARVAGARRVIGSLWNVDDRATAELMAAFYAALGDGAGPVDALRSARVALRRRHAHPYYWAPFVLLEAP